MEDNFKIEQCSENDALEFQSGAYRVGKIVDKIKQSFINDLVQQLGSSLQNKGISLQPFNADLYKNGIDCEILKVGAKGWQKGKVRLKVTLEFCPDEPEENIAESPLDDIRQTMS